MISCFSMLICPYSDGCIKDEIGTKPSSLVWYDRYPQKKFVEVGHMKKLTIFNCRHFFYGLFRTEFKI